MNIPTLQTPRLILRAFSEDDALPMHRILSGKGVLRYFPTTDPPPLDRVHKMILNILKHWEKRGYGLWAVESRATGELMGRCGLQLIPDTNEVEIDFILGSSLWGQGYATEAGQAAMHYGFETLSTNTVVGIVHPQNKASQRVLEKLGMARTRQAVYFGMDCFRYAMEQAAYGRP